MRQNWVEFKMKGDRLLSLRPEYIMKYSMCQEENSDATIVMYDEGDSVKDYYVYEPYERVKQKIMDAEKSECSEVVERFTREEHEVMRELIIKGSELCEKRGLELGPLNRSILNKLNKILNGDK